MSAKKIVLGSGRLRTGSIIAEEVRFFGERMWREMVNLRLMVIPKKLVMQKKLFLIDSADSQVGQQFWVDETRWSASESVRNRIWSSSEAAGCSPANVVAISFQCACGDTYRGWCVCWFALQYPTVSNNWPSFEWTLMGLELFSIFPLVFSRFLKSCHAGSMSGWVLVMASFQRWILPTKAGSTMWALTSCWPAGAGFQLQQTQRKTKIVMARKKIIDILWFIFTSSTLLIYIISYQYCFIL